MLNHCGPVNRNDGINFSDICCSNIYECSSTVWYCWLTQVSYIHSVIRRKRKTKREKKNGTQKQNRFELMIMLIQNNTIILVWLEKPVHILLSNSSHLNEWNNCFSHTHIYTRWPYADAMWCVVCDALVLTDPARSGKGNWTDCVGSVAYALAARHHRIARISCLAGGYITV